VQCKELSVAQPVEVSNDIVATKQKLTGPKRSSYGAPLLFLIAAALQWKVIRAYIMMPTAKFARTFAVGYSSKQRGYTRLTNQREHSCTNFANL
jgi:hypothetical protein